MNTTVSKKEIRQNLESALIHEIERIEGSESSKKIKRKVKKLSSNIAEKVKVDMKKKLRKESKRSKKELKKKSNGFIIETLKTKNATAAHE